MRSLILALSVAAFASFARGQSLAADAYLNWATSKWEPSIIGTSNSKSTIWGENADPDRDGIPNLVEYATGTDPTHHNPSSDCWQFDVPTGLLPGQSYPSLTAFVRTDDPSLRVIAQTSQYLNLWTPSAFDINFNLPQPENLAVWEVPTGQYQGGMRQMRYIDRQSMVGRSRAFMRLMVVRNGASATTSAVDPFAFTPGQVVAVGSTPRSNSITLGGFVGTITINIPPGVALFVNGIAQTGATATVKAGDVIWMQATAPAIAGVPRNHTLSVGGYSATWSYSTGSIAAVPDHPGTDSGHTPVETGVSDSGAAQISIPIVVAPGTAGMQPKLSINYSSQGGNGPLGVGFSLSGLSAVSRVGRTIAQDGVKGTVNFDTNDRFAFDGQRLIAINGADGADGTEYRLEFDPTTRIHSYGFLNGGPRQWIVETKAGLTLEFGTTLTSRISPENTNSVLVWSVESITDTSGNSMVFSYDATAREHGELLLTRIGYSTRPPSTSSSQEVNFTYEDRPDSRTSYVVGHAVRSLKRLKAVESFGSVSGLSQSILRYEMAYLQDSVTGSSRLFSVTEKYPSGSNFSVTTFEWDDRNGQPLFTAVDNLGDLESETIDRSPPAQLVVGDFDGSGALDVAKFDDHAAHWLGMANGQGGFSKIKPVAALSSHPMSSGTDGSRIRIADVNADGLSDIVHFYYQGNAGLNFVALSQEGGTFNVLSGNQISGINTTGFPRAIGSDIVSIDLNGDARTDFVFLQAGGDDAVALSNGDGTFSKIETPAGLEGLPTSNSNSSYSWIIPGEFNGDGLGDLLHLYTTNAITWLVLSNGDGSFTALDETGIDLPAISYPTSARLISGDFNGDGLTDVVMQNTVTGDNWLITCRGNGTFAFTDNPTGLEQARFVAGSSLTSEDINGDGLSDLIHFSSTASSNWIAISKGDGSFAYFPAASIGELGLRSSGADSRFLTGDFDGDGTGDLYYHSYNSGPWLLRSTGFSAQRVVKVVNGHGGRTSFGYKPMTDPTVHTKGVGSAYPFYDLQASMHVVASITSRTGIDGDGFNPPPVSPVGENTINYRYERAWSCLDGRGFMGFKAVESTDTTSGIVIRTEYEDRPLYAGRAKHTEQRLLSAPQGGSSLISESDTIWALAETTHPTGRKTYFVTEASSVSKSYEVNRSPATALVKTITQSGPGVGGSVTYDANGNLLASTTSTTDGAQTFTETVNNTYGDTISPTKWLLGRLATSSVTKTGPNPAGGGTVSLTRSSSFSYHPTTGLLTQEVIEPGGGLLRQQKDYTHDDFGNILTSTLTVSGEAPRTTTTTYTPDGRFVATTTNAEGHTESKTYDPLLGNVLTQTGPNGLTTTWEYDAIGRPIKETRPDGTVTRSFYRRVTGSTVGAPPRAVHYVRVQSSGSAPKTVWYDLLDREIKTDAIAFDGRTVSTHKVFNNRGETTHASQPYFAGDTPLYFTMLYDAVGRMYQQTDPGSRVTSTAYDGFLTSVTNPKNQTVSSTVNAMGWTVQTTDSAGKSINRQYDPYGNLRFVTDPAGNTTELRYDVRGNKTWMSEPNSGVSTFTYNGFGELKTQTNAATQTTTLAYDRLGRVTSRTEPEGVTTFTYDTAAKGIGQLAREAGPGFERRYFYDPLARPAATAETHGFHVFSTSRGYDLYGRPDSMTYPTGFATRQVYNASGHLSEVQNAASSSTLYWRALQVNARGQVTQETLGNGVVTERTFEAETGLIRGITSSFGGTGDVQELGFSFDLIGNLTERRDERFSTAFLETFGYDSLNRLQTVGTTGAAAVTASYNDLGNLTSRSDIGTLNYANGSAGPHALTSVTGSNGGTLNKTCAYDLKGNRTVDGDTSLDYSSFNKPTRIRKGGDTLSFDYGPDRALYRQTIFHTNGSGATSQTVREYIGGLYEREITSEGLVRHIHHIAGGNGVVAIHTDERSAAAPAQRTRFIHKDHLGSVDAITDSNGAVVERQSFDAWGRRRTVTHSAGTWTVTYPAAPGSAETHRGFTGHEMLDLVGLVHMGGRIYDPITARFLSPDPFVQSPDNLQNLNRYSYVLNNPLSYTDPSGFFFKSIGKFFKKHWKTIVAVGVGIWTGGLAVSAFGFTSATASAFAYGAGAGFGSAFSGTLLAGGSVGDALRAGLRAAPTGAVTEGLLHGVDTALPDWLSSKSVPDWKAKEWFTANRVAEQVARIGSRAVIRGASSEVSGGSFSRGAMWSVVPDVARFGVNLTVEYEFRDQVLRDPVAVWKATGGDPNGELQNRGFRFFMGKGGQSDEHGIRPPEDDNNAISSYKWNQAGRSFTEAASKSGGFTGEDSFFMSQIAQRALLGNAHALSHDAFINIKFFNLFKIGDISGVNEFSNVPWAIPTFTAHAGSVPTPWVARPKRR